MIFLCKRSHWLFVPIYMKYWNKLNRAIKSTIGEWLSGCQAVSSRCYVQNHDCFR